MEENNMESQKRTQRRIRIAFGFIGDMILFLPRMMFAILVSLFRMVSVAVVFCINILLSVLNRIVYAVVLILMLYFAMSFQFISTNVTTLLWNELPMDSRDGAKELQNKIDTVFSAGPVSPWSKYVEVEDSFVDYVLLLHEIESLTLKNNDITKIHTLQNVIPEIRYEETSIKNLVISKCCESFELYASPDVETVVLEKLGQQDGESSRIQIKNCQNLKTVEIEGGCKTVTVELENCNMLETIILPVNTQTIEVSGLGEVQVKCENTDLEIINMDEE